jgi:chromosome partitioning protein
MRREIPFRVLLTRTSPQIPTKNEKLIIDELRAAGVPMLKNHLNQRTAFQSMFTYKQSLDELDPSVVNGLDQAKANAYRLSEEVIELVRDPKRRAAA